MKLVTFVSGQARSIGALVGSTVAPLAACYGAHLRSQGVEGWTKRVAAGLPDDMQAFLALGASSMEAARQAVAFVQSELAAGRTPSGPRGESLLYPLAEVRLEAPVPRPGKVLCIGLNYRDHAEEVNMKLPERPLLFAKYSNSIAAPGAPIVLPRITQKVDFEAEFAVVLGKRARGVSEAEALECVAGYSIMNDVSARDLQFGDGQWVRGKTLDTFAPLGPVLVTRDEIPDPHNLNIALRLNGETMQSSNTRNLVFGVGRLIAFLSEAITLEPGDVIATGTPAGVGHNRVPPVYLKPGDVVAVEVEKIGVLENPVLAE